MLFVCSPFEREKRLKRSCNVQESKSIPVGKCGWKAMLCALFSHFLVFENHLRYTAQQGHGAIL
jgi:hypothetical protein